MEGSEYLYNDFGGPRIYCPLAVQVARVEKGVCVGCQLERLGGKPIIDKNRETVKRCTGIKGKK